VDAEARTGRVMPACLDTGDRLARRVSAGSPSLAVLEGVIAGSESAGSESLPVFTGLLVASLCVTCSTVIGLVCGN